MALDAGIVWEIRTTGNANNGAGFKTGASGTDFSQQDAAQYALTGIASSGAGDTFLTASAAADMVGNVCKVVSGTNFTVGWYEILSVDAGVSVTVDREVTTGVGSDGVINIGGALAGPTDAFFEAWTDGNDGWIKAGTYTPGATIDIINSGTSAEIMTLTGYNATRGDITTYDNTNNPLIAMEANVFFFNNFWRLKNINITTTHASGFNLSGGSAAINCKSTNSGNSASQAFRIDGTAYLSKLIACEAVNASGIAVSHNNTGGCLIYGCYIHDSTVGIRYAQTNTQVINTIVDTCATAITSVAGGINPVLINNTLYGAETPTGTGINLGTPTEEMSTVINNIIYGFTTGVTAAAANDNTFFDYNNFFNCTTDRTNVTAGPHDFDTNPNFTDASGGDFSVGSAMNDTAYPGAFPGGLTTSVMAVGAAQIDGGASGGSGGNGIIG